MKHLEEEYIPTQLLHRKSHWKTSFIQNSSSLEEGCSKIMPRKEFFSKRQLMSRSEHTVELYEEKYQILLPTYSRYIMDYIQARLTEERSNAITCLIRTNLHVQVLKKPHLRKYCEKTHSSSKEQLKMENCVSTKLQ